MTFGLTPDGFFRKRLVDIKTELEEDMKSIFGENIDLDPQSGFGQEIGILSEALSNQWQSQENTYNSQYPSTAQNAQLSNVVMYNGIERLEATKSTVTGTITGTEGTVIPIGSKASVNNTGFIFVTLEEVIIPISGIISASMEAENAGAIEAAISTLTVIETPIFGWTSITNSTAASVGRNREKDSELRIRRVQSTQALGQNLVDSLFGQLLNLTGVIDAFVFSNGEDYTVNGVPAHKFLSVVSGGLDEDIADTIWKNTPQGIKSFGAINIQVIDAQGFPQDVKFTRPTSIPIYFKIDITIDALEFPGTGVNDIENAVADYGTANFKISDDVIRSEFYTAINETPGITSIDLRIGLAPSPSGTSNITIDIDEVSTYDFNNVEVNIV